MKKTKIFRVLASIAIFAGLSISLSSCFYHDYRYPRYQHYEHHRQHYSNHYYGGHNRY